MSASLRTFKAGVWTVSGRLIGRLLDFILLLTLSRLLEPSDFGLVALALVPIYIGEAVLNLPLVQSLIRIKNPSEAMYDTAFTLGILRSSALAVVFLGVAYPLAVFYNELRLMPLICALALAPIFRGFVSPKMVVFMKNLDFRREFISDVFGKACAFVVAVTLAVKFQTYWAIAAATITTPVTTAILSYFLAPYRPRLTLSQWPVFKDMIGWYTFGRVVASINWQAPRILMGRSLPIDDLGKYTLADDLLAVPTHSILVPLHRPIMANFSLHDDSKNLRAAYRVSLNVILTVLVPLFLAISFLSDPIVYVLFGEKWLEVAPLLKWLSLAAIILLPEATLTPLALSLDRTRYVALVRLVEFIVKIPALIIGIMLFGIWGAIGAIALGHFATAIASMLVVSRLINLGLIDQLVQMMRALIAALAMGFVLNATQPEFVIEPGLNIAPVILDAVMCGVLSIVTYVIALLLIWFFVGRPRGLESIAIGFISQKLGR